MYYCCKIINNLNEQRKVWLEIVTRIPLTDHYEFLKYDYFVQTSAMIKHIGSTKDKLYFQKYYIENRKTWYSGFSEKLNVSAASKTKP